MLPCFRGCMELAQVWLSFVCVPADPITKKSCSCNTPRSPSDQRSLNVTSYHRKGVRERNRAQVQIRWWTYFAPRIPCTIHTASAIVVPELQMHSNVETTKSWVVGLARKGRSLCPYLQRPSIYTWHHILRDTRDWKTRLEALRKTPRTGNEWKRRFWMDGGYTRGAQLHGQPLQKKTWIVSSSCTPYICIMAKKNRRDKIT